MILFIDACVRKEKSRTRYLAKKLLEKYGDEEVITRALADENLKALDGETLKKRDELLENNNLSDESLKLAVEFSKADKIVIAAPYWDMSFPALLKIYLELINASGITFVYEEDGIPKGLCNAKELSYVTSAGGFIGENNFGFDYVKALASNFWGVDKINFYKAEGLDIIGNNPDKIIKEQIKKYFG